MPRGWLVAKTKPDIALSADDLAQIIYIDHYSNAVTGIRFSRSDAVLQIGGKAIPYARTFEEAKGLFWYKNSIGLVEIAAPRGSAARLLRLKIGSPVAFRT